MKKDSMWNISPCTEQLYQKYGGEKAVYLLFSLFWIIALLPKTVQFLPLLLIALLAFDRRRFRRMDRFSKLQLLWLAVYLVSIGVNILLRQHTFGRILAAGNTFMASAFGLVLYISFRGMKVDFRRLGKICFINTMILLAIYVLYKIAPMITFLGRPLSKDDFYNGVTTLRFAGFLDYTNLILFFVLFSFPFAVVYIENKHLLWKIVYVLALFVALEETHSRSALLVYTTMSGIYLVFQNKKLYRFYQSQKKRFFLIALAVTLVGVVVFHKPLISILEGILGARTGSNNIRMTIYKASLNRMIREMPLIGLGTKEIFGTTPYPYGSHSTYIGVLYRTGILGGILYFISLTLAVWKMLKDKRKSFRVFFCKLALLGALALMLLEDIDGVIWCACYFYVFLALFKKLRKKKDMPRRLDQADTV